MPQLRCRLDRVARSVDDQFTHLISGGRVTRGFLRRRSRPGRKIGDASTLPSTPFISGAPELRKTS
jgi:hypothetical protein